MAQKARWKRENSGALTVTWPEGTEHAGEEWTFSRPGRGYVYCDRGKPEKVGTLGDQICEGGQWGGATISAPTQETFERAVKDWFRQYRKDLATGGGVV